MLTKQQTIDYLDDAIKSHLARTVDSVLTTALNDEQMSIAVRQYTKGLHHSRIFYDRAIKAIEEEYK